MLAHESGEWEAAAKSSDSLRLDLRRRRRIVLASTAVGAGAFRQPVEGRFATGFTRCARRNFGPMASCAKATGIEGLAQCSKD